MSLKKTMKGFLTIYIAKKILKESNKYRYLFERSSSLDETKLVNFFEDLTRKNYPEYIEHISDPKTNPFRIVFKKYMEDKITRNQIAKELEGSPELLEVFENSEEIRAHVGDGNKSYEDIILALAHGAFFSDIVHIKMLKKSLRKTIIFYHKYFCKNWVHHIGWIFALNNEIRETV